MFVFVSDCIAKKKMLAMRNNWNGPVYGIRCPHTYAAVSKPGCLSRLRKLRMRPAIDAAESMEKLIEQATKREVILG